MNKHPRTAFLASDDPALLPRLWVLMVKAAVKTYAPHLQDHHAHVSSAFTCLDKHIPKLVNPNFDLTRARAWYKTLRERLSDVPQDQWFPSMLWAAISAWTECNRVSGTHAWLQLANGLTPLATALEREWQTHNPTADVNTICAHASAIDESATATMKLLWFGVAPPIVMPLTRRTPAMPLLPVWMALPSTQPKAKPHG
jgi:hypothetical protein